MRTKNQLNKKLRKVYHHSTGVQHATAHLIMSKVAVIHIVGLLSYPYKYATLPGCLMLIIFTTTRLQIKSLLSVSVTLFVSLLSSLLTQINLIVVC